MMLTKAQIQEFKANGYLNGGRVLDDDTVEILRSEIMRVIDDRGNAEAIQPLLLRNLSGNDESPVWQIVNIWRASDPFRDLISQPEIVTMIAQLANAAELRL